MHPSGAQWLDQIVDPALRSGDIRSVDATVRSPAMTDTLEAVKTYQQFIGGGWADSASGETLDVINPANDQVIAKVPKSAAEDVDRAVQAAAKAFPAWGAATPADRSNALLKLADAIEARGEEIGRLESRNAGKPVGAAIDEVPVVVDNLRFFAGAARLLEGKAANEYMEGHTSMIRREPVGVVASIAPWNYPIMMAGWKIGPALAAGNTVVLKPSARTPLTALILAELAADILPPGVLNVITGTGGDIGDALVGHPKVGMISVTGDTDTGKHIARVAADKVKRLHLELGGKAPVIVFDDADLDAVAEAIKLWGYWNAGQDCTAATRVIAGPKIYDRFVSELTDQVKSITWGDPAERDDLEMGSLIAQAQADKVEGMVERARGAKGVEIVTGGVRPKRAGAFYEPTVIAGPDQRSEIVQDEVFGPVVTVQRFSDEEQAIAWANDVRFGLAASVWTSDAGKGMRVAKAIQFGTVWINDHFMLVSEMPHGGFKESGYGKDQSMYAVEDYTVVKHVMLKI
jgi:1-pyrroline dehydrogenase